MPVLSTFLRLHRDSIVELFTRRLRDLMAPPGLTRSQLVDHLPEFLDEIAEALEDCSAPSREPLRELFTRAASAEQHGEQPPGVGTDLDRLVREYGLLRDCIWQRLEEASVTPSIRDIRVFSDRMSAAAADAVRRYTSARERSSEDERHHLLQLFAQAPGFVAFLRGPQLVFDLANAAYFQLVGHREILGKPLRQALPEVEGQGYFELVEGAFISGEPFVGRGLKVVLQREPGAALVEAFVDLIYQPIRGADGTVKGILVQGHDVTELRLEEARRAVAEASLRASEERYRTLFGSIDDGYCLLQIVLDERGETVDYVHLEANAAFEAQTGLVDVVGKSVRQLIPDLDGTWFQLYGGVAATGVSARFENHAPALNRWFDVYASRVGDAALRQVAVVFKDVSARKASEEERERLLMREGEARRAAEEASRLKDEFLATVSHELRTPLNAMLGWTQMLRSGSLSVDARARALETIDRNARAQAQLIEDLLDVSSILAGKLRLDVDPLDVRTVVEAAIQTVRPAADAKEIRLEPELATGGIVLGDSHRIQQIVWNLLSNAVKFTPKGGRVQVLVRSHESSVQIVVADTGRGIAPDFQPHVFERFRQAEGGTTRSHGGLGLGLSIVRQLVEMHGGSVEVASEGEHLGATFTVSLPMAVARRRDATAASEAERRRFAHGLDCPPELEGLRVLVVDDEADTREMLKTLLEGCGALVTVASSAAEGHRHLQNGATDVLLSDIGMPNEDGYAFVERVRSLPAHAGGDVPAVALTAYARSEDRTRALLAGFDNHITKPVEPIELIAVVAALQARARKRPSAPLP